MFVTIYDIIFDLFYGSSLPSDLSSFQLFVPEFLSYVCCSAVILIPIACVYYIFKFVARSLEWHR